MGRCELRKAKQRGVVLGTPNVGKMNTEADAASDAELKPILDTMWELPYREIAEELTNRKIPAPRGGAWNAMLVMRAMKRLGIAARPSITSSRPPLRLVRSACTVEPWSVP